MPSRNTATDKDAGQATARAAAADDQAADVDNLPDDHVEPEPAPEPDSHDDLVQRVRRIETILL